MGIAELRRRIERHTQEIDHLMQRIQSAEARRMPEAGTEQTIYSAHG